MAKSNQIIVPEGIYIVSETDLHGKIVSINKEFTEISGYTAEEAIGKPHSLLRHPDMPSEAFEDLWDTIRRGSTWRGCVKNLARNGDYYWVYATVSYIERADGFRGYTSIRQRMTQKEIDRSERGLKKDV